MRKTKQSESSRMMRPALTPEARENQLVSLAVDLAEKQLREGTASSQVITHYLKLGSTKERIEKEILEKQKELIEAKTQEKEKNLTIEDGWIYFIHGWTQVVAEVFHIDDMQSKVMMLSEVAKNA